MPEFFVNSSDSYYDIWFTKFDGKQIKPIPLKETGVDPSFIQKVDNDPDCEPNYFGSTTLDLKKIDKTVVADANEHFEESYPYRFNIEFFLDRAKTEEYIEKTCWNASSISLKQETECGTSKIIGSYLNPHYDPKLMKMVNETYLTVEPAQLWLESYTQDTLVNHLTHRFTDQFNEKVEDKEFF